MPIRTRRVVVILLVLLACTSSPAAPGQSPETKLRLGHYASKKRGIGLVFDRTQPQAKLKFDGTSEIIKIDPQPAGIDRVDYIRSLGHVVLQLWNDGRVVVFVAGADVGIDVVRDGDADPL